MSRTLRLLSFVAMAVGLAFSGSGQSVHPAHAAGKSVPKIAFVTYVETTKTHVLSIADPDGKNVVNLLNNAYYFSPVWSPDGTQLAFVGGVNDGGVPNWELYLINSDGSNLRKVSAHTGRQYPGYVTWSPDGTQLIYSVRVNGDIQGFYRINVDGSGEKRLGFEGIPLMDGWLTWSPDAKQVAVLVQTQSQPYYQIELADSDGENAKPLVVSGASKPVAQFNYMAWAPDQQHIFVYIRPETLPGASEIDVANVDGSSAKVVLGKVPRIPDNLSSLSVSPDGKQILFIANEPNVDTMPQLALWVANANGTGLHALSVRSLYAGGTSWGMVPQELAPKGGPITLPKPKQ